MIERSVNHKLSRVRTDDISGTIFRPGQTNIKGFDGVPLGQAVLGQSWDINHDTSFRNAYNIFFARKTEVVLLLAPAPSFSVKISGNN